MALEVWRLTFFSMFHFLSTSPEKLDAGFSVHRLTVCSGMSLASSVEASVVQGKWSSKEWKENRSSPGGKLRKGQVWPKQSWSLCKLYQVGSCGVYLFAWPEWVTKINFPQEEETPPFPFPPPPDLYHWPLQMSVTPTALRCQRTEGPHAGEELQSYRQSRWCKPPSRSTPELNGS